VFSVDVAIVSHFSIWEYVWQKPQAVTPVANGKKCKWIRSLLSSPLSALTHIYITSFLRKTECFMEIRMNYFVSSLNFPCIKMKFPKTCPILTLTLDRRRNHIHTAVLTSVIQFPILTGFSDILEKKKVCRNFQ
jgi:hypothetical protein